MSSRCLMSLDRHLDRDGVVAVDLGEAHVDALVAASSAGSCRRSPARIGSSRCPRSTSIASRTAAGAADVLRARRARRGCVRPEKSTSSTSTTTLPSMPPAGSAVGCGARVGLRCRSSRYIVTSSAPTGTSGRRRMRPIERGDALGEGDAAGGDAEEHEAVGPLVRLQDLVGDPSQRPGDVSLCSTVRVLIRRSLLRLTGRG